jgi:N,N'-diacetyllegionaminate synthase
MTASNIYPYIIAEAGVNHNGSIDLAFELIRQAKTCGADAVKFQTFKAEKLARTSTPKVPYQTVDAPDAVESHFDMLKKLELSEEQTQSLKVCCDEVGIEFMSTPYDPESVDFLYRLGSRRIKVASADLVDFRIQEAVRNTGLMVIQSVGMATLEEIDAWNKDYKLFNSNYPRILLQCTSNYPSDPKNANLRVLQTLKDRYSLAVGFSDHTPNNKSAILSVAMGATVIEKHFTLDKTMPGPDHKASADPIDFKLYCQELKEATEILGSSEKFVVDEEMAMRSISRKGVYSARALKKGQKISMADVCFFRPGNLMDMHTFKSLLGKEILVELTAGTALELHHFTTP